MNHGISLFILKRKMWKMEGRTREGWEGREGWESCLAISLEGICKAKVEKCRCILGVMLNDPARGFMHATYCTFVTSLNTTLPCSIGFLYLTISMRIGKVLEMPDECYLPKLHPLASLILQTCSELMLAF